MSQDQNHIAVSKKVLEFIKIQEEPIKIGLLYNAYCGKYGESCFSYKTFQRAIRELAERELIFVKKIIGGTYGTTSIVSKSPIPKEVTP